MLPQSWRFLSRINSTLDIPLTLDSLTCFQLIAMGLIFWGLSIFKVRTSFDLSFPLSSPVATSPRNPSEPPFPHR
ncbi:hypothetical protein B0H19DRAFT_1265197 [Mycena capillaripes]|nr:hypothetical protein B0H19DRAFT_1265197 [Mycena capillaripes]